MSHYSTCVCEDNNGGQKCMKKLLKTATNIPVATSHLGQRTVTKRF